MERLRSSVDEVRYAYESVRPRYRRLAAMLETLVRQISEKHGIKVQTVESRAKEIESLAERFQRHPEYRDLSDVRDLCGIGSSCSTPTMSSASPISCTRNGQLPAPWR